MDSKSKQQSEKAPKELTVEFRPKSREDQDLKRSKHSDHPLESHRHSRGKDHSRHTRTHADTDAEVDTALNVLQDLRVDSGSNFTTAAEQPSDLTKRLISHTEKFLPLSVDDEPTRKFATGSTRTHPSTAPPSLPLQNADSYAGDVAGQPEANSGSASIDPQDSFVGVGSYKFHLAENVDEYLKNLGVGLVFRKVQSVANPTLTIYPSRVDEWAIKTDSIFRTREVKFKLGEEFSDETFDGRPCRTVASLEPPDRIVFRQRCPMGPDVKMIYEFRQEDDSVNLILTAGPNRAAIKFIPNPDL